MELLYNKGSRVDRNLRGDYSQGKHTWEMTAAMDSSKTIPIKHSSNSPAPYHLGYSSLGSAVSRAFSRVQHRSEFLCGS